MYIDTYNVLHIICLLVPPPHKESHLNIDEGPVRILLQLINDSIQNVLDGSMLYAIVS